MYKSRISIWVIAIIFVFLTSNASPILGWFSGIGKTNQASIYVDADEYPELGNEINGYKKEKIKFVVTSNKNNADVIISSNNNIDGYDKTENYFTSPIIVMSSEKLVMDQSNVFSVSSDYEYTVNMNTVLANFLAGNKADSIGLSEEKDIVVCIPTKESPYYNNIVDYIYFAMNGNNIPTAEEKKNLKSDVDTIIEKCQKVSSLSSYSKEQAELGKKCDVSFSLFPEFEVIPSCYKGSYSDYYQSYSYPTVTTNVAFNLFIKSDTSLNKENIMNAFENKSFVRETYLRSQNFGDPDGIATSGFSQFKMAPKTKFEDLE